MSDIVIASMNCRGLSDLKKRRDVMHYLRKKDYDILFLQDTHLTQNSFQYFNCLWRGKSVHSFYTNRSRGVSIMFKHTLKYEIIQTEHADCGNFLIIVCKIGTQTYLLAYVYGPNNDNPDFYRTLQNHLELFQTDHTIIGGDFNFVIDQNVDSYNYAREYNSNAKHVFMSFINDNTLHDIWRLKNPNKLEYTWSRNNPLKCGRLDMFFVNSQITSSVQDVQIKPGYRTDHCLIEMRIYLTEIERGPGTWKFNESVLQDAEYVDIIKKTIGDT